MLEVDDSGWRCYVCKSDVCGPTQRCDRCGATANEPKRWRHRMWVEPPAGRTLYERLRSAGVAVVAYGLALAVVAFLGLVVICGVRWK